MSVIPECNDEWVKSELPRIGMDGPDRFNPGEMVRELAASAAIRAEGERTGIVPDEDDDDWSELPDSFVEIRGWLTQTPDWVADEATEVFFDRLDRRGTTIDESLVNELDAAIANVMQGQTACFPSIPGEEDVGQWFRTFFANWRSGCVRSVCRETIEPVVLHAVAPLPPPVASVIPGKTEVWVWVSPDNNNIEHESPDIFNVNASLVWEQSPGDHVILAAIKARLLPTAFPGKENDGANLFEVMDAHSQGLNDVWKTIKGEVLPAFDADTMWELSSMFGSETGGSLCVPHIVVNEAFRGHRLGVFLLRSVGEVLSRADDFAFDLAGTSSVSPADGVCEGVATGVNVGDMNGGEDDVDDDWDDEEDRAASSPGWLHEVLANNPIVLVVLPIEGERPIERPVRGILARGSLAKEGPRRVRDKGVEARRVALGTYFLSLNADQPGFHVHAYNPWDYPFT